MIIIDEEYNLTREQEINYNIETLTNNYLREIDNLQESIDMLKSISDLNPTHYLKKNVDPYVCLKKAYPHMPDSTLWFWAEVL